jgi:hypothetical protein
VKKKALALGTDQDRLAFGKRELFWLPSGGYVEPSSTARRSTSCSARAPCAPRARSTSCTPKYFG